MLNPPNIWVFLSFFGGICFTYTFILDLFFFLFFFLLMFLILSSALRT